MKYFNQNYTTSGTGNFGRLLYNTMFPLHFLAKEEEEEEEKRPIGHIAHLNNWTVLMVEDPIINEVQTMEFIFSISFSWTCAMLHAYDNTVDVWSTDPESQASVVIYFSSEEKYIPST